MSKNENFTTKEGNKNKIGAEGRDQRKYMTKQMGEYNDKQCYLFCDLTFMSSERNQFYLPHPHHNNSLIHSHRAYIYVQFIQTTADRVPGSL